MEFIEWSLTIWEGWESFRLFYFPAKERKKRPLYMSINIEHSMNYCWWLWITCLYWNEFYLAFLVVWCTEGLRLLALVELYSELRSGGKKMKWCSFCFIGWIHTFYSIKVQRHNIEHYIFVWHGRLHGSCLETIHQLHDTFWMSHLLSLVHLSMIPCPWNWHQHWLKQKLVRGDVNGSVLVRA